MSSWRGHLDRVGARPQLRSARQLTRREDTRRGLRVGLRKWRRSRRRTRDLVTQAASQGLSQNEIGCARISMMARNTNAPCKGRIQMRKTTPLHLFTFGLQRMRRTHIEHK